MKHTVITFLLVMVTGATIVAQDNIKRPETFYYQSGTEAYSEGEYKKSMDYFEKELASNPKNGYAMIWQAYIYGIYEMYGTAIEKAEAGMKLIPKKDKEYMASGYNIIAKVYQKMEDSVKALDYYDRAFRAISKPTYIYSRCDILHAQKRYAEEEVELKRIMLQEQNSAMMWTYLGRNEYAKGNYTQALEKYDYAVKLDPSYSSSFAFRADTYLAMHKYKEACQDIITALDADDNKAFYQLYQVADSGAIGVLTSQLKAKQLKQPNVSKWSYYSGIINAYKDRDEEAEVALREAVRIAEYESIDPKMIFINYAETLNELGHYQEALVYIDKCKAIDSTNTRIWYDESNIYYNMGRNREAIESLNQAIACSPSASSYYYYRARVYMYSGQLRNALDDINTAIGLSENTLLYYGQRAEIYCKLGRTADAIADCQHVLDEELAEPESLRDNKRIAYAYARMGRTVECRKYIRKIEDDKPSRGDTYDLACLYSLIDDKDEALDHLEMALQMGYHDFVHINNDTDLDNIRTTNRFHQLIKKYNTRTDTEAQSYNDTDYIEEVTEVPFTKDAGIYKVRCTVNGLPLQFYFDTGAADVTISSVEAQFMLKNGYLSKSALKGTNYYGTASGDIAEGTTIILDKVEFGGLMLQNVKASVVHNQKAPILLGQTVLSRLGKIEIDYTKSVLKITNRKRK